MASLTSEFAEAETGVFWDIVDCDIPIDLSLDSTCENIKSALVDNGYRGKVSIRAYCDTKENKLAVASAFKSSGIKLIRAGDRYSRLVKMMKDLILFAVDHKPSNLMVISQNISEESLCVKNLVTLRKENRNLLLAQIEKVTGELFGSVSSIWYWRDLSAGGKPFHSVSSQLVYTSKFASGFDRGQFGKASPSKDVEGTLVVHGCPIETTEEEIRDAFGDGRKPMCVYTGSLTVATFPEEEHAAKTLQSTIGIDGFSVDFAQDNDLYDLSRSLHARVPTHAQLRPMDVIWDWENCTIPSTFPVDDLYENVQKYLYQRNFYISSFNGYGDRKQLNDEKFATLSKQGMIKLIHVDPSVDRDVADIEAKKALLQIMVDRLPPSPSLVISGNRDFMKVILALRKRNYEVYLAYNDKAQADLKNSATKCCPYEDPFGIDRNKLTKPKGRGGKSKKRKRLARLKVPTDGEDQKMDEA